MLKMYSEEFVEYFFFLRKYTIYQTVMFINYFYFSFTNSKFYDYHLVWKTNKNFEEIYLFFEFYFEKIYFCMHPNYYTSENGPEVGADNFDFIFKKNKILNKLFNNLNITTTLGFELMANMLFFFLRRPCAYAYLFFLYFTEKLSLNDFFKITKEQNTEREFKIKTYHDYSNTLFAKINAPHTEYIFTPYNFKLHAEQFYIDFTVKKIKAQIIGIVFNWFQIFIHFFIFFKNFILAVITFCLIIYLGFFLFYVSFLKTISVYIIFGLLFFWLFSTFNFFIKRYKFGKYTSAIQRFWKRAFMCFWLIEGFLFTIFFFYLVNASNEPFFMYDTYGLYLNSLPTIKNFLINNFLTVLIINLFIFLLINIKFASLKKNIYLLLTITFIFIYILFVESYQFYYLLNFYSEYIWIFSEDDSIWELDYDIPRTRTKNHYMSLLIIAKFWHYLFIFISWLFFLTKTLELNRFRYAFLSMNLQNTVIFYIMNWLCLYSWFKWIFRRFGDQSYYWFFTSFRVNAFNIIVNDVLWYLKNFLNLKIFLFKSNYNHQFIYLFITNEFVYNPSSFFKLMIKPVFIY